MTHPSAKISAAEWADSCTFARNLARKSGLEYSVQGNVLVVTDEDGREFTVTVEPVRKD